MVLLENLATQRSKKNKGLLEKKSKKAVLERHLFNRNAEIWKLIFYENFLP